VYAASDYRAFQWCLVRVAWANFLEGVFGAGKQTAQKRSSNTGTEDGRKEKTCSPNIGEQNGRAGSGCDTHMSLTRGRLEWMTSTSCSHRHCRTNALRVRRSSRCSACIESSLRQKQTLLNFGRRCFPRAIDARSVHLVSRIQHGRMHQ
jgi:hypothetical protein